MPRKKRADAYHHGDLRRELLRHAHALVNEWGVEQLSLRDLARAAGVSQSAPFRHFENKAALICELAEEGFAELEAAMVEAGRTESEVVNGLLALSRAYLHLAATRPHFFRMMFSADLGPSRVEEGVYRACDRVYERLRQLIVEGQKDRVFVEGDPDQQALFVWSAMHGFSMLKVESRLDDLGLEEPGLQSLLQTLLRSLFRGMAPI